MAGFGARALPGTTAMGQDGPVLRLLPAGLLLVLLAVPWTQPTSSHAGRLPCALFPSGSHWRADVTGLPVHPDSDALIAAIGADRTVKADFGSGLWEGGPIGIPFAVVPADQRRVPVTFDYADESDPGGYPIPPDAPVEGGPQSDGDRHVIVLTEGECRLYELFDAHPRGDGWHAGSGAIWDLDSHALRPDGWTSADAAGLPILPGLVRFEEVRAGVIDHAIRFTAPRTRASYVWPARHQAGSQDPSLPPMGLRVRLRADFTVDDLPEQARVVARALQTKGAILADNGSPWFLSGVPDERWDNDALRALGRIPGSAFEVLDSSRLQLEPDSEAARLVPRRKAHSRARWW